MLTVLFMVFVLQFYHTLCCWQSLLSTLSTMWQQSACLALAVCLLLADVTDAQEFSYLNGADICSEFRLNTDDFLLVDDPATDPQISFTLSVAAYDAMEDDDVVTGRHTNQWNNEILNEVWS